MRRVDRFSKDLYQYFIFSYGDDELKDEKSNQIPVMSFMNEPYLYRNKNEVAQNSQSVADR